MAKKNKNHRLRITSGGMVQVMGTNQHNVPPPPSTEKNDKAMARQSTFIQQNKIELDDLWTIMTGTEMYEFNAPEPGDKIRDIGFARGEYVLIGKQWHEIIDVPKTDSLAYLPVSNPLLLTLLQRYTARKQHAAEHGIKSVIADANRKAIADATKMADDKYVEDLNKKYYGRDDKDDEDDVVGTENYGRYMNSYRNYDARSPSSTNSNYSRYEYREPLGPPHPTPMTRQSRARWSKDDRVTVADYPAKHRLLDEGCD